MKNRNKWICIALIAACIFSFKKVQAQAFVGFTGTNKGVGIQTGALIKDRLDLTLGVNTRVVSDADKPIMFYSHLGWKIRLSERDAETGIFFTPAIGYSLTKWDDLSREHLPPNYEIKHEMKKQLFAHSELAIQRGVLRAFTSVTWSTFFYVSFGVKGFIVLRNEGNNYRTGKRNVY
ncbi:MAG: hypothetical protein V4643_10775 [Bacteroidota bacterium]